MCDTEDRKEMVLCPICRYFLGIELKEIVTYITSNGNCYEFSYEVHRLENGRMRINILDMPSYGSRDTSLHKTQRAFNGIFHFVDLVSPLHSLEDAKKVAAFWAERTDQYIKTGRPFTS